MRPVSPLKVQDPQYCFHRLKYNNNDNKKKIFCVLGILAFLFCCLALYLQMENKKTKLVNLSYLLYVYFVLEKTLKIFNVYGHEGDFSH